MCLLIATTGNARPSKKALRRAAVNNPDGFGWAIIGDGRIYTFRSMDAEETIKSYFEVRDEFPNSNSIFHLRITTHGATNIDNCHPFRINDDVVMGHNGMLPIKEDAGRSDTRIFAEDWLPEFDLADLLDTQDGIADLSKFAGGSKLAFLNTSSLLSKSLYIINEDLGHWQDGVWYSNNSYKKTYGSYTFSGSYTLGQSSVKPYTPTYKVTDKRRFTPEDEIPSYTYRPWSPSDLVWDAEECIWVQDSGESDVDEVCWTCSGCHGTEIFDLSVDAPDFCHECGQCWYCEMAWHDCFCASFEDEL